jgi:hypothetical protein
VLWNYDRRVLAVLAVFVLGTIGELSPLSLTCRDGDQPRAFFFLINYVSPGAGGVDLGFYLHTTFKSSDQALQQGTGVKEGDARAAIMIGPTLATNLLSTLLIGIRAW